MTRLLVCAGSYTEPVPHAPGAHGRGIEIAEIDLAARTSRTLLECDVAVNPAFVRVHPSLPVIYATSESWTGPGAVVAVRLEPGFTALDSTTSLPSAGDVPAYLAVVGDHLVLANYGDGSLAAFRLGDRGELLEQTSALAVSGSGPDPVRQRGPHTHCVLSHPCNGFLYAADLGADLLLRLGLDPRSGRLSVLGELQVAPGAGPRHIAFSPGGDTAFVVEEIASRLAVYGVGPTGDLVLRQRLTMLPDGFDGQSTGADVAVMPDGSRVFASNRGHDSVVSFAPDDRGGWRPLGWTSTGATPRGLALTGNGRHLLVASQDADSVAVLEVTEAGLIPVMVHASSTPTCLQVLARR